MTRRYAMGSCRHLLWLLLACVSCSAPTTGESITSHWLFRVTLERDAEELAVLATLPPGPGQKLTVASGGVPFLSDIQVEVSGSTRAVSVVDDTIFLEAAEAPRSLRWRFAARAASTAIDDIDVAAWRGRGFVGSLGTFLLRPVQASPGTTFDLRVDVPAGLAFACASDRTAHGWRGTMRDLSVLPACTFGAITVRTVSIDEGNSEPQIDVVELLARPDRHAAALDEWVRDAARAARSFFGAFPVDHLLIVVASSRRPGISGGSVRGFGGARIFVDVPPRHPREQFRRDWVLFHEMIHLALPSLPTAHHWLEEGSATYLEPLLQARAGRTTEAAVWAAILSEYSQGLPTLDDGGLDDDRSWGRTYYGGAVFCLLADIEIRRRTDNQKSLQDVMRAVVASGGNITAVGRIDQVLAIGDQATGTTVLSDLYARMRSQPHPRELDSLWQQLGVRIEKQHVVFDEGAPLAAVRKALILGNR